MSNKNDRFMGKTFAYKTGTIVVAEKLGVCYEDSRSVFYVVVVKKATRDHKAGARIELPYQALRALLMAQAPKRKTTSKKAA